MRRSFAVLALIGAFACVARPAHAAPAEVIIVTAPGGMADQDDAQQISQDDLDGIVGPNILRALESRVAGLSLAEATGNGFQPNLSYRGFSASPLQGNAQGLAVYLDGGRFNLPFGDTVHFDLLPDNAVESLSLRDSNPVYGLNGLGGALVVATHNGRTAPGISGLAGLGDHGQRVGQLAYGHAKGDVSLFVAGQARHDGGWRDYSPANLAHGFADLGWDGPAAGVHMKVLAADTNVAGNGTTPLGLLAGSWSAVLTHPDQAHNRLLRTSLHPWIALADDSRIEASLYVQSLRQRTENGDLADIGLCPEAASLLCLEHADADVPLRDVAGNLLSADPKHSDYGVLNRTRTHSESAGLLVHYVRTAQLLGVGHKLTLGLAHDRATSRFAAATELAIIDEEDRTVIGLGPILRQPDGAIAPIGVDVRTRHTGLLLWDEVQLASSLTAEIGLRWNSTWVTLDDQLGKALNGRHHFARINPGVELDYQLRPALNLRLGYAQTSRAPTPAELSCADEAAPCSLTNFFVADPPLDQVVATNWEAGARGIWEGAGWQGRWSLALYRTDISNDVLLTAAATRGRAFFRNIGQSRRQGLQAQWQARHGPWVLNLGYAYGQAQFRAPFLAISPDNPAADDEGRILVSRGSRLPGIPAHRLVASLAYTTNGLVLRAAAQLQSHLWRMGDEANLDHPVPGYARFDLGADLPFTTRVSAFVDVTNLLNRHYASFGAYSQIGPFAPSIDAARAISPAAPRRVMLGLRLRQ